MTGRLGWAGIAAVVAVADIWAVKKGMRTLTAAYRECPKWVSLPATALVVAHLMGWLPPELDPFERFGAYFTPKSLVSGELRPSHMNPA